MIQPDDYLVYLLSFFLNYGNAIQKKHSMKLNPHKFKLIISSHIPQNEYEFQMVYSYFVHIDL